MFKIKMIRNMIKEPEMPELIKRIDRYMDSAFNTLMAYEDETDPEVLSVYDEIIQEDFDNICKILGISKIDFGKVPRVKNFEDLKE